MQIDRDALRALPFLAVDTLGERVVNLMPLWDGEAWHQWLPFQGGLTKLQTLGVVVGEYLAQAAEAPTDLSIPFLEFAWQRASWPEVFHLWRHLTEDIHNFATCVAKLEHYVVQYAAIGQGASAYVQTELEYLFILARSVFDLIQELVARAWKRRVCFLDAALEAARKQRQLPSEFSRIVLNEKSMVRSAEEISAKFPVSPSVARAYASAGVFFSRLREMRDKIVHGGKAVEMI